MLVRDGKVRNLGQLRAFATGFCGRIAGFDWVDVGIGKEGGSARKVRGKYLHHHIVKQKKLWENKTLIRFRKSPSLGPKRASPAPNPRPAPFPNPQRLPRHPPHNISNPNLPRPPRNHQIHTVPQPLHSATATTQRDGSLIWRREPIFSWPGASTHPAR